MTALWHALRKVCARLRAASADSGHTQNCINGSVDASVIPLGRRKQRSWEFRVLLSHIQSSRLPSTT